MTEIIWGMLGPEQLHGSRRTRTLGLGAAVRLFNELAVPGLGGVWFGKQLLLATLGIVVAEEAREKGAKVQNIEVANAIEALACRSGFETNGWKRDPRLRGSTKLQAWGHDDFGFKRARQRSFYVTQPMRMATVQALPSLGFVDADSARFNAFRASAAGQAFVDQALLEFRPFNRTVIEHLAMWACGEEERVNNGTLRAALSVLGPLGQEARRLLREQLIRGGNESTEARQRRGKALEWVDSLRNAASHRLLWESKPSQLDEGHWHDLRSGALFFKTRETAIKLLDALEAHIANQAGARSWSLTAAVPEGLAAPLDALRDAAGDFLQARHANPDATAFCQECQKKDASEVLRALVGRDGQVLRLVGRDVRPGLAFQDSAAAGGVPGPDPDAPPVSGSMPFPEHISRRVHNLHLLNLDMQGGLDQWLAGPAENQNHGA